MGDFTLHNQKYKSMIKDFSFIYGLKLDDGHFFLYIFLWMIGT
jgi:hypothetical protein